MTKSCSPSRPVNQNYINHIAVVLDESGSMTPLARQLITVTDAQIAHLAARSQELNQETRVTVYTFADTTRCLFYDKDVLRLPSIAQFYRPNGGTALIDATLKSQRELAQTATLYGDHSFLTFVLTDGEENRSRATASQLSTELALQADNWTLAVFVPDQTGKYEAKKFGFPADNIAVWDATTNRGVVEVGETIRQATDNFMAARATGLRGTRTLFSMDAATLNPSTVRAANLSEISPGALHVLRVDKPWPIREYVEERGLRFQLGNAFYQLVKPEKVQAGKDIAIRHKASGKVYSGAAARGLLGLPDMEVKVQPDYNPDYDVFVQSTSVNRKLVPGTDLLYLR